ncbi:hypothetical protein P154DRAFT_564341 [Amniculicola lignicola CBS 123094]|uniref:Uncharacterized protein n=1 Tax=Amniculicola lignicola CBS 123094 TaxID=1392246 RepID=A0A6A5WN27_9PLEO|nr:hypothetical protein P154DRAFT_564341 [Amniculicola lignicola CBS 123094]
MAGSSRSLNPTCEDYHSDDDSEGVVDPSFRRSPGAAGQANVAAKRSHPSDLGTGAPAGGEKVVNIDLQSDSGYSSHTAATMSSADSAPSASSHSPPVAAVNGAPLPPPSPAPRKRPSVDERKYSSRDARDSRESPRKPLQTTRRTGSVSSRTRPPRERRTTITAQDECTDPRCTTCGPNATSRGRRPSNAPPSEVSYAPSQRSEPIPSSAAFAPSPVYNRQLQPLYTQGQAIMQPAQSTRTRRSSSNARARPVTYHEGQSYYPYASPQEQRGPPPAASAYHMGFSQMPAMSQMSNFMMGATPPNNMYSPLSMHMSPTSYDMPQQRPPMGQRAPSNLARRPTSQLYGQPLIQQQEQPTGPLPSARYGNAPPTAPAPRLLQASAFESDSESESSGEELDAVRMPPPPKPKTPAPRRPSLRRPATTQVYNTSDRMTQSAILPERTRERDPRASKVHTAVPSRASSVARPVIQHSQSTYEQSRSAARNAEIYVESTRSRRRQSVQEPAPRYEPERKRDSKIYRDEAPQYEPERPRKRDSKIYRDEAPQYEPEKPRKRDSKVYREPPQYEPERERKRESKIYRDEIPQYEPERERKRESKIYRDEFPQYEPERERKRDSKVYRDDRIYQEDAIVQPLRGRRTTDASTRRRADTMVEAKDHFKKDIKDAEAYQQLTRGSEIPLNEQNYKAAKRAARLPTAHSETGSKHSRSNQTTVTNANNNGEIRLRVDTSAPISLQFSGDTEGRTLQINPVDDGMAELVISSARGHDQAYRSERGSVFGGRKQLLSAEARREIEEASVKSSRSHSSREQRDRRGVLRRRREIMLGDSDED